MALPAQVTVVGVPSSGWARTMSLIPTRPPGRRTRAISANVASLSPDSTMTQLEMTTSTDASGSGIASMVPWRNSTLVAPASAALRRARSSISTVASSP